jgi:ethanolamine ammonia-lyase small subunit
VEKMPQKQSKKDIRDISTIDLSKHITIDHPQNIEFCRFLKQHTQARICEGAAGSRYKTETLLRLRADHALAIDAVWSPVDECMIDDLGLVKIQTLIQTKEEFIKRPDLGRCFSPETMEFIKKIAIFQPDVQILVSEGLSATSLKANLREIYPIILDGINARGLKLGTPLFIRYGRVATMDKISELLLAKVTLILIGERPGLTAGGESMSCYMAYESSSKKPESQRTVISNIHRNGTPAVEAGALILSLIENMIKTKKSGIELKR